MSDHLDNDKEDETVSKILIALTTDRTTPYLYRLKNAEQAVHQYTQSKLKAFAGEVEEAIPTKGIVQDDEDLEDEFTGKQLKHELQENNINFGKNDAIDSFVEALKAIKEKYQL